MKHVYYCRHGLSIMNQQGLLAGSTDTPLTDEGREQAKKAAQAAKADGLSFDLIIASPLSRARETAEIMARELGIDPAAIIFDERAVERNFGDMEGTEWYPGIAFGDNPTIEPLDVILARARSLKDFIDARPEQSILLVSHGAFIRAIRSLYQPDLPFENKTATMPNAEVTLLQ